MAYYQIPGGGPIGVGRDVGMRHRQARRSGRAAGADTGHHGKVPQGVVVVFRQVRCRGEGEVGAPGIGEIDRARPICSAGAAGDPFQDFLQRQAGENQFQDFDSPGADVFRLPVLERLQTLAGILVFWVALLVTAAYVATGAIRVADTYLSGTVRASKPRAVAAGPVRGATLPATAWSAGTML